MDGLKEATSNVVDPADLIHGTKFRSLSVSHEQRRREKEMKKFTVAIAAGLACTFASAASAQSLTTLFASNNGGSPGGAVYFTATVFNTAGLNIEAFDINTSAGVGTSFDLMVYVTPGGHSGNETDPGAWTQVATGTGTSAGTDLPSFVDITNFQLLEGSYGIALVLSTNAAHRYTNGTGSNEFFSNSDLSLALGSATNVPFQGTPFSPRVWNGTVYYSPIPAPGALALLGLAGACGMSRRRRA